MRAQTLFTERRRTFQTSTMRRSSRSYASATQVYVTSPPSKREQRVPACHSLLARLCARVSHDIRSPLAALDAAVCIINGLDTEQRNLVRSATNRIKDIANDLLSQERKQSDGQHTVAMQGPVEAELISAQVDRALSEKRLELRGTGSVAIASMQDTCAVPLFACIDRSHFRRIISNLLNNAIEAHQSHNATAPQHVHVKTELRNLSEKPSIVVSVCDNGPGMPPNLLARYGQEGFSHGKLAGNGIGAAHAKESLQSWGGRLEVESSVGVGTIISCVLPACTPPAWFKDEITLASEREIVVVDDDDAIHEVWRERFQSVGIAPDLSIHHLRSLDALDTLVNTKILDRSKALFLVDFDFAGSPRSGLQAVTELGLGNRAVLVTSHHEDSELRQASSEAAVLILPKELAGFVPITRCPTTIDLALLDDDIMIHRAWALNAGQYGKRLATFRRPQDLLAVVPHWSRNLPIYVDCDLGKGVSGTDIVRQLLDQGFTRVFLATGHSPSIFRDKPWIKAVGKAFPLLRG